MVLLQDDVGFGPSGIPLGSMDGNPTTWQRLKRVDPRIWDAVLTIGILAFAQLDLWRGREPGATTDQPDLLAAALLLTACVPLYWRRQRPLAAAAIVSSAGIAYGVLQHPSTELILPLAVAAYSAAAFAERSVGQLLVILAAIGAAAVSQSGATVNWVEVASGTFFAVGVPVAFGRVVWNRHRTIERDREQAARDAVTLERGRIARELHDIVAHSMSVMVVQAGGARTVLKRDPDEAERALRAIEESGRLGLAELRRLLAAEGEPTPTFAPQPGLEALDDLLDRMRATGLAAELVIEGEARPLPLGVDLSSYRIVQEALTNSLTHGGNGPHARVLLRYTPTSLEIDVTDDGVGAAAVTDGIGRGLIGMRERVAFLDGDIETGPRLGGGFVVRVRIPIDVDGGA
jgi:signal transduction histidine kinase